MQCCWECHGCIASCTEVRSDGDGDGDGDGNGDGDGDRSDASHIRQIFQDDSCRKARRLPAPRHQVIPRRVTRPLVPRSTCAAFVTRPVHRRLVAILSVEDPRLHEDGGEASRGIKPCWAAGAALAYIA